jgi:hypothetical protein
MLALDTGLSELRQYLLTTDFPDDPSAPKGVMGATIARADNPDRWTMSLRNRRGSAWLSNGAMRDDRAGLAD